MTNAHMRIGWLLKRSGLDGHSVMVESLTTSLDEAMKQAASAIVLELLADNLKKYEIIDGVIDPYDFGLPGSTERVGLNFTFPPSEDLVLLLASEFHAVIAYLKTGGGQL
jgi:hypothetical protein